MYDPISPNPAIVSTGAQDSNNRVEKLKRTQVSFRVNIGGGRRLAFHR